MKRAIVIWICAAFILTSFVPLVNLVDSDVVSEIPEPSSVPQNGPMVINDELIIALRDDMEDMNPWNPDTDEIWKTHQIGMNFQGLMDYNPDYDLYPVLAAANASGLHGADVTITNGGMNVAVKLREGVTFTDGTPMTSRDVVLSYQTLGWTGWYLFKTQVLQPLYWDDGTLFEDWDGTADQSRIGVQANGTYGVDFYLTEPYAMFWYSTLGLPICPANVWDNGGNLEALTNGDYPGYEVESPQMYGLDYSYGSSPSETNATIGTGPWYLESWDPGNGSIIKAYEGYWDKNGTTLWQGHDYPNYPQNVKTISFEIYIQTDVAIQDLQNGDVHHLPWSITPGDYNMLKTDPNIGIEMPKDQGFFYLNFNQRHGAMQDVEFRRAVSYAIDKDYIVNNLLDGYGIQGSVPMTITNTLYVNTSVPDWIQGGDLTAAQQTLNNAGYLDYDGDGWRDMPDGSPLKYDILTPPLDYDPIRANSGIMIEQNLKSIGLNVASVPTSFDTLVSSAFVSLDFDMYILGWTVGPFPENYLRDFFHSSADTAVNPAGSNSGGYDSPEFDTLVDNLEVEMDTDTRVQMVKDACGLVMQDVAYNTLFYKTNIEAFRQDVWQGWVPAFGSIYNSLSINNLSSPSYLNPTYGNLEVGLYVPDVLPADDNSTCYVLVTDNDVPVDNAYVEVQTNFGATFNGSTNSDGNIEFSYYVPFMEGQAFFSASVSKGNDTGGALKESLVLTSKPFAQLSLSTDDGVIPPDGTTVVTARVTDRDGVGMSGIDVYVDEALIFGTLDYTVRTTDSGGNAWFNYTAPPESFLPNTHRHEQFKANISVTDALIPEVQQASLIIVISNNIMDWHMVNITSVDDYVITGNNTGTLPLTTDVLVTVIDEASNPVIGETVTIDIDNSIAVPDAVNKVTDAMGEVSFTVTALDNLNSQSTLVSFNVSKAYSTTDSFLLLNHNETDASGGYAADIDFDDIVAHQSTATITATVWDETGAPAVGVPCQFFIPPTAQGITGLFQGGDEWGWYEYGGDWDMGLYAGYIGSWYDGNSTVTDGAGQLVATIDTPSYASDSIIPLQFGVGGYGVTEGFNFSANQWWWEDYGTGNWNPPMTDGADGNYYWRAANFTIEDSGILRRGPIATMTNVELDAPYLSPDNPNGTITMTFQNETGALISSNVKISEGIASPILLDEGPTDGSGMRSYLYDSGLREFDAGIGFTSMVTDPNYSQFPFVFYFPYIVMPDSLIMTVEPSVKLVAQDETVEYLVTLTDIFGSPVNGAMVWAGNVSNTTDVFGETVFSLVMTGLGIQNTTFNLTFDGKNGSMTAGVIVAEEIITIPHLDIIPDDDTMDAGTYKTFTITFYDEFGNVTEAASDIVIDLSTTSPNGKFLAVPDTLVPKVLYATGHGEVPGVFDNFADIVSSKGISFIEEDINIVDLEEIEFIIINNPESQYTAGELTLLNDYVQNGGGILLLCESDYSDIGKPENCNPVLENLGIEGRFNDDGFHDEWYCYDYPSYSDYLQYIPYFNFLHRGINGSYVAGDYDDWGCFDLDTTGITSNFVSNKLWIEGSSVSSLYNTSNDIVVIRGTEMAYNMDNTIGEYYYDYPSGAGTRPPALAANDSIGSGRVLYGGIGRTIGDGNWYGWAESNISELSENIIDWLVNVPLAGPVPEIMNVTRDPWSPTDSQSVTIQAEVVGAGASISSVVLNYAVDDGPFNQTEMSFSGGTYEATIQSYPSGTVISYYIHAVDENYQIGFYPIEPFVSGIEWYVVDGGNQIVISEVCYDPPGADSGYEFLELYNPLPVPLSLEGWYAQGEDGSSNFTDDTYPLPQGSFIPAYGFFLIAQDMYSGFGADVITDMSMGNGPFSDPWGDSVKIIDSQGNIIDRVAWDDGSLDGLNTTMYEAWPALDEGSGSIERLPGFNNPFDGNYIDTDNNSEDFIYRPITEAQGSASLPEYPPWATVPNDNFILQPVEVTSVIIPAGQSSVTFEYYDIANGTWMIQAANGLIADGFANITILGGILPVTYDIALSSGWNLISIPLEQEDTSLTNVLSSINGQYDVVKYYDATDRNDPWKSHRVGASTNDLTDIDHNMGIWVHMLNSANLTVGGAEPVITNITLNAGWNLVGYPSLTPDTVSNALWGTGATRVEVCDLAEPYLIKEVGPAYVMQPGEGYWIQVPTDTVWTVDW